MLSAPTLNLRISCDRTQQGPAREQSSGRIGLSSGPLTLAQVKALGSGDVDSPEQKFFVSDDGKEKLSITKAELQAGIDSGKYEEKRWPGRKA